jgi:hypothetical protein
MTPSPFLSRGSSSSTASRLRLMGISLLSLEQNSYHKGWEGRFYGRWVRKSERARGVILLLITFSPIPTILVIVDKFVDGERVRSGTAVCPFFSAFPMPGRILKGTKKRAQTYFTLCAFLVP